MELSGLVSRFPYINQTDGAVESVKHCKRHRHVPDDRPPDIPIKIRPCICYIVRFDLEGLRYPRSDVTHDQECY